MRIVFFAFVVICLTIFSSVVDGDQNREEAIEKILKTLTLEEKLRLCSGDGGRSSKAIKSKGIPRLRMHNGPRGARVMRQTATCFPCGTAMASSWDTDLVSEMAAAIGAEMYKKGGNILLAPAMNIQRDPLGGRTFEYLTEDPFLNARLTVAFVKAAQAEGVACNLKHYVANNQDNNRNAVNSDLSERALREIYFPAFKAGVIEGKAWTVMTAANKVQGLYASDSKWLLNDVLKGEWGFDGLVLTDWCETRSGAVAALSGLDLSMPGRPHNPFNKQLAKDVADGKVSEDVIDEMVRRLLRTAFRTHMLGGERPKPRLKVSAPETAELSRKVAAECMVLLKNDVNLLPLDEMKIKRIALFGPNVDYRHNLFGSGGGSSNVESEYYITPIAGLKERLGDAVEIIFDEEYSKGSKTGYEVISSEFFQTEDGKPGLRAEYFNNPNLKGKPVIDTVVPEINFLWEMGAPNNDKMKRDKYSCRWTGYLIPPEDGLYSIKSMHDDGARVWIDDHPHMRHWIKKGYKEWAFKPSA